MAKIVKVLTVITIVILNFNTLKAQLFVNEVSQGAGGNPPNEYIELVVVGNPSCSDSTLDIRGWIIDDNNGFFGTSGIASGHIKFANSPQWESMPYGSIILIYNNQNPYPGIVSDPTDANNDLVYILDLTNNLFESNTTVPTSGTPITTYSGSSYTTGTGFWNILGMKNTGDLIQVISPANMNASFFSVGWGTGVSNTNYYYGSSATGKTIFMSNAIDNNPFNSLNWTEGAASANGTPGYGNSIDNSNWLNSLRKRSNAGISNDTTILCANDSLLVNGSWIKSDFVYQEVISHPSNCDSTVSHYIVFKPDFKPQINGNNQVCKGEDNLLLTEGVYDSYLWNTGEVTDRITISNGGEYSVTVTRNDGCTSTESIIVEELDCFDECVAFVSNSFTPNGDGINDYFTPTYSESCDFVEYELIVFDRWGKKIFIGDTKNEYWDGNLKEAKAPSGIYIWKLKYRIAGEVEYVEKLGVVTIVN